MFNNGTEQGDPQPVDDQSAGFKLALTVLLIAVLTFLSQTFTGLNIGLMSLDTAQLQVLIDVPNKDEAAVESAKHARKILPLRQKGNLLLCTILLGNTAVNALMAQLLADYAGGAVGFLLTTAIIVILCEIVPQSICTRHGLFLGAAGSPIIRLAMILFYPLTKPYAMILDRLFPQRENLLDRSQLRALVEYQEAAAPGMLAQGQADMLIGALGVAQKTVKEVMVPLDQTIKMYLDDVLEYDFVAQVVQEGFSRFPVIDRGTGQVQGLLHCKDLLTQRFIEISSGSVQALTGDGRTQTVKELLQDLYGAGRERRIFVCGKNTTLMALLSEFKRRPHLAVVAEAEDPGEVTWPAPHIGIITLHNIFEMILQAPVGFSEDSSNTPRRVHRQAGAVRLFDQRRLATMAAESLLLGQDEAEAVLCFLVSAVPAFRRERISEKELLRLLTELRPLEIPKRAEPYRRGERASSVTLVLQGALRIVTGEDGCESTAGPWACLGVGALTKSDEKPYLSDFTATALTDCLVLQIEHARYSQACQLNKLTPEYDELQTPWPA
eukprot:TRINITY_DN16087_c1_g1_i1.p1 TRINITY_DN16087_c1_g1~~TRINITY_DN16087_c1_g1_i1.p1  ORF type:complete len:552 (+),score=125.21 TRINITY_DN16087_c1_g1_i1:205-1860(+)